MTADINIINDLSTLTTVPAKALNELIKYENLCIGNAIKEAALEQKQKLLLNIGLGTLCVELASMQCKFIPSSDLKNTLKLCLNGKNDLLLDKLQLNIAQKLVKIYQGVLT